MTALLTPATSASLLRLLAKVRDLPGAIAELGVFDGDTLKALAEAVPEKQVFGFDTFEGIPASSFSEGDFHRPGEFAADYETVAAAMPSNVVLVRGVFPDSACDIAARFCFCHVDLDVQKSTEDAIAWLAPRMVPGGIAVFDDWGWRNCPGVAKAITRAELPVIRSNVHQCYWVAP